MSQVELRESRKSIKFCKLQAAKGEERSEPVLKMSESYQGKVVGYTGVRALNSYIGTDSQLKQTRADLKVI